MNADDERIDGLALLDAPPPRAGFWDGLHDELATLAADPTDDNTAEPLDVDITARQGPRRVWLAAACLIVVGLAATVLAVVVRSSRPDEPGTPPDAGELTPPAWYRAIAPSLPEGFDHIAVIISDDELVVFEVLDIDTTKVLGLTVSRVPVAPQLGAVTLSEAQSRPWSDLVAGFSVSLPDGRQVGVACLVTSFVERDCPPIDGVSPDPEALRALALTLATDLPVDDLPLPGSVTGQVSTRQIDSAIRSVVDLTQQSAIAPPGAAFSFVEYGSSADGPTELHVRAVAGFLPALGTVDEQPRSIELASRLITWQAMPDGSVWTVTTTPNLTREMAVAILRSAAQE